MMDPLFNLIKSSCQFINSASELSGGSKVEESEVERYSNVIYSNVKMVIGLSGVFVSSQAYKDLVSLFKEEESIKDK